MTNATILVDEVLGAEVQSDVPVEIVRVVERHKQTLLGLAQALIAAGRGEDEVIAILKIASDSFSNKLKSEIEKVPS